MSFQLALRASSRAALGLCVGLHVARRSNVVIAAPDSGKKSTLLLSTSFSSQLPSLPPHTRRLFLVRHGQTDWNMKGMMQGGGYDIPLNTIGKRQAARARDLLATVKLDVVASSPLSRAKETADIIASRHPSALRTVEDDFKEMRFGSFEGLVVKGSTVEKSVSDAFNEVRRKQAVDPTYSWPTTGQNSGTAVGESPHTVRMRATAALEKLMASCSEDTKHLCVVAHGRLNRILLGALFHVDDSTIDQGNTCINVVDFDEATGDFKAILINYEGHMIDLE